MLTIYVGGFEDFAITTVSGDENFCMSMKCLVKSFLISMQTLGIMSVWA